MLFVDPDRYNRPKLNSRQREFFIRLVPLAGFLQQQTYNKALVTHKPTKHGVFASLLAAHMLYKSEWGNHPVTHSSYNAVACNNLALLEAHKYWKKSRIELDGKFYRGYKNWREFAIDYSDYLAWHDGFEDVLKTLTLKEQIEAFSLRENNVTYFDTIVCIIKDYGLTEFDHHGI